MRYILYFIIAVLVACGNSKNQQDSNLKSELDLLNEKIAEGNAGAEVYYERALLYAESDDFSSAISDFKKCVEIDPDFISAYHDLGICYYSLDEFEKALNYFNIAIEKDDEFVEAYFNRSLVWDITNNFANAIADLNKVIELDSEFYDAYYNRGVYLLQSNPKQACEDFAKAAEGGIEEAMITFEKYCE